MAKGGKEKDVENHLTITLLIFHGSELLNFSVKVQFKREIQIQCNLNYSIARRIFDTLWKAGIYLYS